MPKFLPSILTSKLKPKERTKTKEFEFGKLELDAAPITGDEEVVGTIAVPSHNHHTTMLTPVNSDINHNSMVADVPYSDIIRSPADDTTANASSPSAMTTLNAMNIHNAQQQVVMQFSNVNRLHIGSVYNFNANSGEEQATSKGNSPTECQPTNGERLKKATTSRKTTTIVAMMQSQETPDHRILDAIATHLGEGWKLVMRNLGQSEGQIEQALINHQMHGGIKEVIYQLLLQWVRNADDGEATIAYITSLLWQMNHRECVHRMKLAWKSVNAAHNDCV